MGFLQHFQKRCGAHLITFACCIDDKILPITMLALCCLLGSADWRLGGSLVGKAVRCMPTIQSLDWSLYLFAGLKFKNSARRLSQPRPAKFRASKNLLTNQINQICERWWCMSLKTKEEANKERNRSHDAHACHHSPTFPTILSYFRHILQRMFQ